MNKTKHTKLIFLIYLFDPRELHFSWNQKFDDTILFKPGASYFIWHHFE